MSYQKLTPIIAKEATEPRYLEDRFADVVNVKDFGAVGDGTTNDTAAFEAAGATGKSVFVPNGSYVVEADVSGAFFSVDSVEILGSGSINLDNIVIPAMLYFNPQSSTLSDGTNSDIAGECNVIKIGGKVVMIDVGGTNRTDSIKNYLENIGVTKVDYLILTHYHGDHVGNILSGNPLGLDWSGCTVYLNSAGSTLSDEYASALKRKALCEAFASTYCATTVYPSEGDTLEIGDATFTFLNCGSTADGEIEAIQAEIQMAGISTQTYPLNDYSICVLMEKNGLKCFYAADIQYSAERRLVEKKLVGPVDLLKFQHHSANSRKTIAYYIPFANAVRTKYVVVQNGTTNELAYPRLECLNWADESIILKPLLEPSVFSCGAEGLSLVTTDNIAKKGKSIELFSGVNILGEGQDLDDVTLAGTYTIMSSTEANTMLHTPMADSAGQIYNSKLVVMHGSTSSYLLQIIFNSGGGSIFMRDASLSNNEYVFTPWRRCINSVSNEEIGGIKTFTSEVRVNKPIGTFMRVKANNVVKGTPPESDVNFFLPLEGQGQSGAKSDLFAIDGVVTSDGRTSFYLTSYKNIVLEEGTDPDLYPRAVLGVTYPAEGDPWATAPTTPATGRGTDVVTRNFLETQLAALEARLNS